MSIEFKPFPKIPRLNRDCVIQEKIDGTNASIVIVESDTPVEGAIATLENRYFFAGKRTSFCTPAADNFGFANWVAMHIPELYELGPGTFYGEWWGGKIQRGYGVQEKRFSLFNTTRFCLHGETPKQIGVGKLQHVLPPCVGLVPELYRGLFSQDAVNQCLQKLRYNGSYAAPGFGNPEGIVVFHEASGALYKVTLEGDEKPKSL